MIDPVMLRANGKFVLFIAAVLHGAGVQTLEEFAETLAVFASVVSEDEPAAGDVLAFWAAGVRDLAGGEPATDRSRPAK